MESVSLARDIRVARRRNTVFECLASEEVRLVFDRDEDFAYICFP